MRARIVTLSGALALLLSSGASALSPETEAKLSPEQVCDIRKLEAVSNYHDCLIRGFIKAISEDREFSESELKRCDGRFNHAFEDAEGSGACRTPGGASTLREPVEAFVRATEGRLSQEVLVFTSPSDE